MRALLLDGPVYVLTHLPGWLYRAYCLWLAASAILCFTTVALTLLLWLLGVPVPLPPDPHVIAPSPRRADAPALVIAHPARWPCAAS
jgi:hypothetical protein